MSYAKEQKRVEKIKRKYGANAFKIWGEEGGNPVLIAQGRGDKISIHKKKSK
jgi:hypothetical protein